VKLGLNLVALPFILHLTQESLHRVMAAPRQSERSFGQTPFPRFKFALRQPGMGEAYPQIRSGELIAHRSPLLIIYRHTTPKSKGEAVDFGLRRRPETFCEKRVFLHADAIQPS
jgi:hypothetical protein